MKTCCNLGWRPKQIAMDYRDSSWMAVMLEIMGEQDGLAFMKNLRPRIFICHRNLRLTYADDHRYKPEERLVKEGCLLCALEK